MLATSDGEPPKTLGRPASFGNKELVSGHVSPSLYESIVTAYMCRDGCQSERLTRGRRPG